MATTLTRALSWDKSVGKIWSPTWCYLAVGLSKYNLSHFLETCAKYTFSAQSLLSRDFLQFIANCLHEDKKSPDVQGLLFSASIIKFHHFSRYDNLTNYYPSWIGVTGYISVCIICNQKVMSSIPGQGTYIKWCQIENQQSPVYVINFHFWRWSDRCLECYQNLALMKNLYHNCELSNEVFYPIPIGVSKMRQVKVVSFTFVKWI